METIIFLIFMFLAFATLTIFSVNKFRSIQAEDFGKALAKNLVTLHPENRYILSFPFEISDEKFDRIIDQLKDTLDLENSNTHLVIVQGSVKMIEFS